MAKETPITKTALFIAVKDRIKSISNQRLAIELNIVRRHFNQPNLFVGRDWIRFKEEAHNINRAFTWDQTPQGHAFWNQLHNESGLGW